MENQLCIQLIIFGLAIGKVICLENNDTALVEESKLKPNSTKECMNSTRLQEMNFDDFVPRKFLLQKTFFGATFLASYEN